MSNMRYISTVVTIIFLTVIGILLIYIQQKQHNILGTSISINPIDKSTIIFNKIDGLSYFYEPRPNSILEQKFVDNESTFKYVINLDSLNSEHDYIVEKTPQVYRIMALGDSWTFGMFVDTSKNYPSLLEDMLNKNICSNFKRYEVINLGMIGYDILYSVERFKIRGQKYQPDLIIWFLKDHNFKQIEELIHPMIQKYTNDDYPQYNNEVNWSLVNKGAKEYFNTYSEDFILEKQKMFLSSIRNYFSGDLLIVNLFRDQKVINITNEFIGSSKNTYIYSLNKSLSNGDLYFSDGHPNQKGYKIISEEIYKFLNENKIIPCN